MVVPTLAAVNIARLRPVGYSFIHTPRLKQKGGGVGLVYRSSFRARRRLVGPFSSFEHQIVTLRTGNVALQVVIVYKPSGDYTNAFEADFTQLQIFSVDSLDGSFVVLGDFNFHINVPGDSKASKFISLLDSLNLFQHVQDRTHCDGNTLDLIITRNNLNV